MGKKLSEMSLEELWQLFPIFLVPYDEAWKLWYENEEQRILTILPHGISARISHIGSTAIPGIYAKNIVDNNYTSKVCAENILNFYDKILKGR